MLASLIAAFASGEARDAMRRARMTAIVYLAVAVLVLVGIGFLVGAGYMAVAQRYGGLEAAIAFGVGFLVIAVLILIARSIAASTRRRRRDRRAIDLATIAGAAAVTALPLLLRSRVGLVAPLVALAAYAIYRENRKDSADGPSKRDE